jgi:hypothetical protein
MRDPPCPGCERVYQERGRVYTGHNHLALSAQFVEKPITDAERWAHVRDIIEVDHYSGVHTLCVSTGGKTFTEAIDNAIREQKG